MIAALLILWLTHDAAAQGDLARVAAYAERLEVVVSAGHTNLVSDAAAAALRRYPGLAIVELHGPVSPQEAAQLRKARRVAVWGAPGDRSYKLLGPALVRASARPQAERQLEPPCPATRLLLLAGGAELFEVEGRLDECALGFLRGRLDPGPRAEPLSAQPAGALATVLLEVEGEGRESSALRAAAQRLAGRTLSGVSLPVADGAPDHVLTVAALLPGARLGREVPAPGCEEAARAAVWRLTAHVARGKGRAVRLGLRLAALRCEGWAPAGERESGHASLEAALEALPGEVERALSTESPGGGR